MANEEFRVDNWPKRVSNNVWRVFGHSNVTNIPWVNVAMPLFSLPNLKGWTETSLTWNNEDQIDRSEEYHVGSLNWAESFFWNEVEMTVAFANDIDLAFLTRFITISDFTNGVIFA